MFKKRTSSSTEGLDTLIGIDSGFEGNLESEGNVKIDGKVKGNIKVSGDVFVGEEAVVKGEIYACNAELSGCVEGNLHLKGVLKLLPTAKLLGDIQVHGFVTDEGAIFHGKCNMLQTSEIEGITEKSSHKKSHSGKDYKKSSVISQIYDDKEKNENTAEV